tara:strand:- start:1019 stop:1282 length:264 start_codon:yes stop_codon:yes gene_type:complete
MTEQQDLQRLEKAIVDLKNQNFFLIYDSIWRLIGISLIQGLASGLGWILGATLLVSLLSFFLSQIEFIPIIGKWVSQIILEISSFER